MKLLNIHQRLVLHLNQLIQLIYYIKIEYNSHYKTTIYNLVHHNFLQKNSSYSLFFCIFA